jgi:hypothetical protein
MQANVGSDEKALRLILGAVILVAGAYFKSAWGLLGLIPLFTGLISWCPLYRILGITTCKIIKK